MQQLSSANFLHLLYILMYHISLYSRRIETTLVILENLMYILVILSLWKVYDWCKYTGWPSNSQRQEYFAIIMLNPGKGGYKLGRRSRRNGMNLVSLSSTNKTQLVINIVAIQSWLCQLRNLLKTLLFRLHEWISCTACTSQTDKMSGVQVRDFQGGLM